MPTSAMAIRHTTHFDLRPWQNEGHVLRKIMFMLVEARVEKYGKFYTVSNIIVSDIIVIDSGHVHTKQQNSE